MLVNVLRMKSWHGLLTTSFKFPAFKCISLFPFNDCSSKSIENLVCVILEKNFHRNLTFFNYFIFKLNNMIIYAIKFLNVTFGMQSKACICCVRLSVILFRIASKIIFRRNHLSTEKSFFQLLCKYIAFSSHKLCIGYLVIKMFIFIILTICNQVVCNIHCNFSYSGILVEKCLYCINCIKNVSHINKDVQMLKETILTYVFAEITYQK